MASNPMTNKKFLNSNIVKLIAGLLVVSALGAGAWFLWLKPAPDPTQNLTLVPATREPLYQTVAATGKVVPNFEVEIKAKASGKIMNLPYDVSDVVKQGELLVELDPIDENRQVNQAQASLAGLEHKMDQSRVNLKVAELNLNTDISKAKADLRAAQAKAKEAKVKADRLGQLVKDRFISQEEYETGMTTATQAATDLENARIRLRELETQKVSLQAQKEDIEIAEANAEAQRVALATSEQRLSETRIYAPISGVITSRAGQVGLIVSSGISNVGGGTAIMTLADLSRIFVLASVDESDIGQVREGQTVRITADSYPGKTFEGKVIRIAPKGLEETNVVTFEVKIEVQGENKQLLKPEMTTNVEIQVAGKPSAITVPSDAIVKQNGKTFVNVLDESKKTILHPVETGLDNGSRVEIINGLSAGQKVILGEGQSKSRWRREPGQGGMAGNRRGQRMMMRGMGKK